MQARVKREEPQARPPQAASSVCPIPLRSMLAPLLRECDCARSGAASPRSSGVLRKKLRNRWSFVVLDKRKELSVGFAPSDPRHATCNFKFLRRTSQSCLCGVSWPSSFLQRLLILRGLGPSAC